MLSGVQRLLTLSKQQPFFIAHHSVDAFVIYLATTETTGLQSIHAVGLPKIQSFLVHWFV
jgi:hypothetical protein